MTPTVHWMRIRIFTIRQGETMQHGSNGRTTMTSLKQARQVVNGNEEITQIKRAANKAYRRRTKQQLAQVQDFDESDFNMNPREYDTAWKAY